MLKILVNSYTCCPGMGSEQGMGWHWIINLARFCDLFVISEGEYRTQVEAWLAEDENHDIAKHLHFYWNPIGGDDIEECERIRKMCWNQGQWSFYYYYEKWQKETAKIAKRICCEQKIDVLHQLNMIGFREPGFLWEVSRLLNIPLVWGPIDAKKSFPMAYAKDAPLKFRLFCLAKNIITLFQLKYGKRIHLAADTASCIVSASSNSVCSVQEYFRRKSPLINETGCYPSEKPIIKNFTSQSFDVLWVGKVDFRKQLSMALESLVLLSDLKDVKLHIVGGGSLKTYQQKAHQLGVSDRCVWYGAVSHNRVQELMQNSELFLFTSVAEGTPHVVMESLANGLPVICLDTCGQGDCVTDKVGIKLPLTNAKQSVVDFASAIRSLHEDRAKLDALSRNCKQRQQELSWDVKVQSMVAIYNKVLTERI